MNIKIEVQCVACKAKRMEGPRQDTPLCNRCFMPMVVTGRAKQ
jgi:hypothetical protein